MYLVYKLVHFLSSYLQADISLNYLHLSGDIHCYSSSTRKNRQSLYWNNLLCIHYLERVDMGRYLLAGLCRNILANSMYNMCTRTNIRKLGYIVSKAYFILNYSHFSNTMGHFLTRNHQADMFCRSYHYDCTHCYSSNRHCLLCLLFLNRNWCSH